MKILLFGISNIGKTTTGQALAQKLGYSFYDLDDEVKKYYKVTLEQFVNKGTLEERDKKRTKVIRRILKKNEDMVFAITPMSYFTEVEPLLEQPDVFPIELVDDVENVFDRLVFSDENDVIYEDQDYKFEHIAHYMKEIGEDFKWYGYVYRNLEFQFYMNGDDTDTVVERIIDEYGF